MLPVGNTSEGAIIHIVVLGIMRTVYLRSQHCNDLRLTVDSLTKSADGEVTLYHTCYSIILDALEYTAKSCEESSQLSRLHQDSAGRYVSGILTRFQIMLAAISPSVANSVLDKRSEHETDHHFFTSSSM